MSAALVVTALMAAQSSRAAALEQTRTAADTPATGRLDQDKKEAAAEVDRMRVMTQQMIDQVFSFGELSYREFESTKYLTAGKAYFVRAGVFKDVDICLFVHVSDTFGVRWGDAGTSTGAASIEYTFTGESAHAALAWKGAPPL